MKSRSRPRQWKRWMLDKGALYPWPDGAPLLILKLPRIAGHGNRLQSGKHSQSLRRAAGGGVRAVERRCHEDAADAVGLLHGMIQGRGKVAGADELLEPEPCSGT